MHFADSLILHTHPSGLLHSFPREKLRRAVIPFFIISRDLGMISKSFQKKMLEKFECRRFVYVPELVIFVADQFIRSHILHLQQSGQVCSLRPGQRGGGVPHIRVCPRGRGWLVTLAKPQGKHAPANKLWVAASAAYYVFVRTAGEKLFFLFTKIKKWNVFISKQTFQNRRIIL